MRKAAAATTTMVQFNSCGILPTWKNVQFADSDYDDGNDDHDGGNIVVATPTSRHHHSSVDDEYDAHRSLTRSQTRHINIAYIVNEWFVFFYYFFYFMNDGGVCTSIIHQRQPAIQRSVYHYSARLFDCARPYFFQILLLKLQVNERKIA